MKQIKVLLLSILTLATTLTACSKDDDNAPSGTHKVLFRAETSADGKLSTVTYTNATGEITSNSSVNSTTFTSAELTVPSTVPLVSFAAVGTGTSSTATIKVQIYIDGKLAKENTSSGTNLSSATTYSFQ